ncbi:MAG TPA: hypothetical protein VFZ89_04970 [Solirubrobacteraceae bacterium]
MSLSVTEQATEFLLRWLAVMDSDSPERVLDMITPDFHQSILFGTPEGAREWLGGRAELEQYLAQREPDGQEHLVESVTREGDRETLVGYTTRYGERLATYVMIAELSGDRVRRLFCARTPNFHFA